MYQNLLFDLDGTLTDSAEGITKCCQYGLAKLGIDEPDLDKLRVFIGPPLRASYMKYYGLTEAQAEQGVAFYRERYTDIGIWENKVYPGMMDLLQALKGDGRRLGMATAKPEVFAKRIAERFGFNDYLEDVTGCSLDGKTDNKALVVAAALAKWNIVTPEQKATIALIGDRREDVLAAHANGIPCIGVGFGFAAPGELQEAGAEHYVETVDDLRKFLLK
ncbi:HAD hydrolase-like protein [Phascolarctobacterium sp.]|uniref:HAD hydrolase-like protein n=1 Tax=Phascolarctobacterium sp. TaxID=2049039 RepID=UPI00386609B1